MRKPTPISLNVSFTPFQLCALSGFVWEIVISSASRNRQKALSSLKSPVISYSSKAVFVSLMSRNRYWTKPSGRLSIAFSASMESMRRVWILSRCSSVNLSEELPISLDDHFRQAVSPGLRKSLGDDGTTIGFHRTCPNSRHASTTALRQRGMQSSNPSTSMPWDFHCKTACSISSKAATRSAKRYPFRSAVCESCSLKNPYKKSAAFIDSSPNWFNSRLDHAGLVVIQFRRGPGGSPNAARRIPPLGVKGVRDVR